ncbi:MAG: carboxy-S-adenosyl-L-methionine synthase CmoA [Campylobacter sp.]|nr:carboxy-S-adenosyl-L-methionine synthase CmoA [Campylobacter sp.]
MRDEIFKAKIEKQFEFDESVASVFDDMISRSVPYYSVSLELICDILSRLLKDGARVFDLGSSTANLLLGLFLKRPDLNLNGIDSSLAMIQNAKNKTKAYGANIKFINSDILNSDFSGSDAIILNYTLQFIRPILREDFIRKIYSNLNGGGVFILSEKLIFEDNKLTKEMIEIYESYKQKQGYSDFEIAQKRKALENVLIPYTQSENIRLCQKAGFKNIECIFRWGNFASFIAFK